MNRHQRRSAKHAPQINGGDVVIKNGKIVKMKKGPPTWDDRLKRALVPVPYYNMKPIGTDGARVVVTVYDKGFKLLDVRAPREGEGPSSYAIAVREALRGLS